MKNTWLNLNIKEKIAIVTAIAAFIFGWGLSIAGFCLPPLGDVADSVLWILGQALIYSASVFGVTSYFNAETVKMKRDISEHIDRIERMRLENIKEEDEDEG